MQDQCRHNEQCRLPGPAGKLSKNVYYMVNRCHYDSDLVHSEITYLGMQVYTRSRKTPSQTHSLTS
jgi:hypothetical protein